MAAPDNWQKSSFSGGGDGNNCLELASAPATLHLRESDTPATVLTTTPTTVAHLLAGIRTDALTAQIQRTEQARQHQTVFLALHR